MVFTFKHKKLTSYKILGGKPERKRLLGRHRCKGKDNSKMDLREI
jgi:hypothetical protein